MEQPRRNVWAEALLLAVCAALLGLPALLVNGFPLSFPDTPGYFEPAFNLLHHAAPPAWVPPPVDAPPVHAPTVPFSGNAFFLRPFPYTLALLPFATDATVWLIPLAQGALAAWALRRATDVAGLALRPLAFAGLALGLALLTSLPVHVGYIMPDLFTGVLILLAYAAVWGWAARSVLGRLFDVALLAFLIAAHLSHVALALGLVAVLLAVAWWRGGRPFTVAAVLGGLAAPLALAAGVLMAANLALAGKPVLSESSPVFLLARLIGDGPARAYLAEACPTHDYLLCAELDRLGDSAPGYPVSDYFLWHPQGARHAFGDTPRFLAEAAAIDRATVLAHPGAVLAAFLSNAAAQFVSVGLDETLAEPPRPWTRQFFSRFGAPVYAAFLESRQMRGTVPREALNAVQTAVLAASLLALAWLLATRGRRLPGPVRGLLGVLALGLGLNAAVTGGLSAVHERYQNRVIWLLPFGSAAAALAVSRSIRPDALAGTPWTARPPCAPPAA